MYLGLLPQPPLRQADKPLRGCSRTDGRVEASLVPCTFFFFLSIFFKTNSFLPTGRCLHFTLTLFPLPRHHYHQHHHPPPACVHTACFVRPSPDSRPSPSFPGLSSFQESVAMDRIQRIMGVLRNAHMG